MAEVLVVGLDRVRIEPTFIGGKAAARVRLGPVTGTAEASRLLARVRALGYTDAFLTTAASSGAKVSILVKLRAILETMASTRSSFQSES